MQRLVHLDAAALGRRHGLRRRERRGLRRLDDLGEPPSHASSIARRSSATSRAPATSSGSRLRRSSISAGSRLSSPFECGLKRYVSRTRKNGAPVSRMRATARPAARGPPRRPSCRAPPPRRRTPLPGRDRAGELELDRRRLRVVVVLDDEQDGQLPERRDVQRLVRDALAERAVAEEHGRDRARALHLLGERDPGRDRDDAPEHAVRVEVAPAEVLAAALAAADPVARPITSESRPKASSVNAR